MQIHPKARSILSTLAIPSPIQKYFTDLKWDIDLSNNTNPYLGYFAEYPDVKQDQLKQLYLTIVLSLNRPSYFNKGDSKDFSSENVLFTAGSMEGLDLVLRTFLEPKKDTLCITLPTFPAYEHWALIHGVQVKTIPLFGENLNQILIEDIIKICPKVVFLCDPNNPAGTKLETTLIQKLCESFDGLVVVDEAYIEFSNHPSSLFYLNKYKNLIILRTFSKAWGLAGVRCGVILADKSIINALRYVQLPFAVSSPSQSKVRTRLLQPKKTFSSWNKIKKNRDQLIQELTHLKSVIRVYKSDANFIMIVLSNFQKTMALLKEYKIHVLDCSPVSLDSIRVSIGSEDQNNKFLEVLQLASDIS